MTSFVLTRSLTHADRFAFQILQSHARTLFFHPRWVPVCRLMLSGFDLWSIDINTSTVYMYVPVDSSNGFDCNTIILCYESDLMHSSLCMYLQYL